MKESHSRCLLADASPLHKLRMLIAVDCHLRGEKGGGRVSNVIMQYDGITLIGQSTNARTPLRT